MAEDQVDTFKNAKLGAPFKIYIDGQYQLDHVRKLFLDGSGLALHIKAKVGPSMMDGNSLICDVEAIDDPVLDGEIQCALPAIGAYVIIGHFKAPEGA